MNLFFPFLFIAIFLQIGSVVTEEAAGGSAQSDPSSNVVVLNNANFEHLTQASTGATTGDWFVKFYAPWCKHCKDLAPIWEEVANELKGTVNVAKVDVMSSKELGTRFDIKGFPMLLLLSKGHVYTFKGRRSQEELVDFARGGFQMHEPQKVRAPLGIFGEILLVYEHATKQAAKDIKNAKAWKDYLTIDVFITALPAIFIFMLIMIFLIPMPQPPPKKKTIRKTKALDEHQQQQQGSVTSAQPMMSGDRNKTD